MKPRTASRRRWLVVAAATVLAASLPAHANIILSVVPVTVAAGSVGDFLDIDIANTGPSAQNIDSFSLALSVGASSGITFTGATESTGATYLFAGDSFDTAFGLTYATVPPPPGSVLQGSDLSNSGSGRNMAAGSTFGLGHIEFNVAPGTAAGPITISILSTCIVASACTSLSDSSFAAVPFSVTSGAITVTPGTTSVPEPTTLWLGVLGIAAIVRFRR